MQAMLSLDEDLIETAKRVTGLDEVSDVVREALVALIARDSGRQLARLGGSEPDLALVPRRRPAE